MLRCDTDACPFEERIIITDDGLGGGECHREPVPNGGTGRIAIPRSRVSEMMNFRVTWDSTS